MQINWSLIGWIAAVVILYLIGYYEGRAAGYKRRKKDELKEKETQPPLEPKTVTETVTVAVDDPGLLRIKNENETYTLDLDGTRTNPLTLLPEQRKRLIELLNVMRPWLEGKPAPSVASPEQSALRDRLQSVAASSPAQPAQTSPAPVAETRQSAPSPSAPPPPPANPQPAASKSATIAKEDRPAAPANSIVSQIDSILQERLAGTPLEERGIFLTQSSEGGVIVYIGLTRYNGIDEVPDPEIKAVIRAAITEWENKYTPGLSR